MKLTETRKQFCDEYFECDCEYYVLYVKRLSLGMNVDICVTLGMHVDIFVTLFDGVKHFLIRYYSIFCTADSNQ